MQWVQYMVAQPIFVTHHMLCDSCDHKGKDYSDCWTWHILTCESEQVSPTQTFRNYLNCQWTMKPSKITYLSKHLQCITFFQHNHRLLLAKNYSGMKRESPAQPYTCTMNDRLFGFHTNLCIWSRSLLDVWLLLKEFWLLRWLLCLLNNVVSIPSQNVGPLVIFAATYSRASLPNEPNTPHCALGKILWR